MVVILVLLAPGGLSWFKDDSSPSRSSTVGVGTAMMSTERIAYGRESDARDARSSTEVCLVNGLREARNDHSDQPQSRDVLEQLLCLAVSLSGCASKGYTTDRKSTQLCKLVGFRTTREGSMSHTMSPLIFS